MQLGRSQRFGRREFLRLASLASVSVAAGSLLAACGSGAATSASSMSTSATSASSGHAATPPASTAQASSASTPKASSSSKGPLSGQSSQITIAVDSYWGTLDFRKLTDYNDWRVAELLYSALVRNSDQFQPVPDLAEKWEISTPTEYVFHLRQAKFQDGTSVTSADVKSTFDSIINPSFGAPNRPLFAAIQSVDATDPLTVTMRLSSPNPSLMAFLPWIGIVPARYAEQYPKLVATKPIGCGPYKFVSTVSQNQTILEAFDSYWGGTPAFAKLEYRVIPEATTRTVEIQSGDVDMATTISYSDISTLKQNSQLYVVEVPPSDFTYLGLNLKNPALADVRIRQAIAYAIDKSVINKSVYYGLAKNAIGPVLPSSWGFDPDVTVYNFDLAKAKQLLAAAGHSHDLKLKIMFPNTQTYTQTATILQQQLGDAGIKLDLNPQENTVVVSEGLVKGNYGDILLEGWGEQMDPEQHMYRQFLSSHQPPNGYNFVHYSNPTVDKLLTQANAEMDQSKRKQLLFQAQKLIVADAPYIFLFNETEYWTVNKRISNVTAPPPMDRQFLELALHAHGKSS